MHYHFHDITSRIAEPPSWYDYNGTPRYGAFTPAACPSIYASEVVLLEIACQNCRRKFKVEMHRERYDDLPELWRQIKSKELHYGDPPAHRNEDMCVAGDASNCLDYRVLEYWSRTGADFKRKSRYEVALGDHGH